MSKKNVIIHGAGGKNGAARQGVEGQNTLRAGTIVKVLEVLSEGEIVGLENTWKDVYLNQTPIQNADDTFNFEGVSGDYRTGLPTQAAIKGFEEIYSTFPSNTPFEKGNPVTHQILGTNVDSATVTIGLDSGLILVDEENGDRVGYTVNYKISVQRLTPTLGSWELALDYNLEGKTVSPYQIDHRFDAPTGADTWQFKVERVTDNDEDAAGAKETISSALTLARWTEIQTQDDPLTYPDTALAGISIPAEEVGNQIPTRGYLLKGIICQVPVNYDPVTRVYSGDWLGNFKSAWTDNPAWILYDIITNKRYGIGTFIGQDVKTNKWEFYDCGVYSDELIPNGAGVDEPRFTFNAVINKKLSAWQLVQTMASNMRAVVISDGLNNISLVQDRPTETSKILTNSNVIGGLFTYSSSDISERITAVNVTFNDKYDRYLPRTISEPLSDDTIGNDFIDRYGYNVSDVVAYACVTEAQARRMAKWILYSSLYEYDNIAFSMGSNVVGLEVGNVVEVMDNDYITADNTTILSGKVLSVAGTTITLDSAVDLDSTNYTFSVMSENFDAIHERAITNSGKTDTITISSALPAGNYDYNDFFCHKTGSIEPRPYRITSIVEKDDGEYMLTAVFYDPQKWGVVEDGLLIEPYNYNLRKPLAPITGLTVIEDFKNDDKIETSLMRLTWDYNPQHLGYQFWIKRNKGNEIFIETTELFIEFEDIPVGTYDISGRAIGLSRTLSPPVSIQYIYGIGASDLVAPINFQVAGGGTIFATKSATFTWEYPPANEAYPGQLKDYVARVYTTDGLTLKGEAFIPYERDKGSAFYKGKKEVFLRETIIADYGSAVRSFKIEISSRDLHGRESLPVSMIATNPAPGAPGPGSSVSGFGRDIILTLDPTYVVPDASDLLVAIGDSGFTPSLDNVAFRVPATAAIDGAVARVGTEGTFYVRFAISDTYNEDDLNWTAEYTILIQDGEAVVIFPTPDTPVNLGYSQVTKINKSGETVITTRLFWDSSISDVSTYTVGWINDTDDPGVENYDDLNATSYILQMWLANKDLIVRVRANYGNVSSAWSNTISFNSGVDSAGPSDPTSLIVSNGYDQLVMNWDLPPEDDYHHTELWLNMAENNIATAEDIGNVAGNSFTKLLTPGLSGWFWVRHVDSTGNVSGYYPGATSGVIGTTSGVDYNDISNPKPPIDATRGAPAGTFVNGVAAIIITSSIDELVIDFDETNNTNYDPLTAPVLATDGTAVDHTLNDDGSANITFEWTWSGAEELIDGFSITVRSSATDSSNYVIPTTAFEEIIYQTSAEKRVFAMFGVPANDYYSIGVMAYRKVNKDATSAPAGILISAFAQASHSSERPYQPSANVAFNGSTIGTVAVSDVNRWSAMIDDDNGLPEANATVGAPAGTYVGGVYAEDLVADLNGLVVDFDATNNTNYNGIAAPTLSTTGGAVDHVVNPDGSVNITFEWVWGGSEQSIDGFSITVRSSSTDSSNYTIPTNANEEVIFQVPANKRVFAAYGVPSNNHYSIGIMAYRKVNPKAGVAPDGIMISSFVQASHSSERPYTPSATVAFTGDTVGTVAVDNLNKWSYIGDNDGTKPDDNANYSANTYNNIFANPPTANLIDGDMWYPSDTKLGFRYDGVSAMDWVLSSNRYDNTSDLTDGDLLGETALWTGVGGRPTTLALLSQIDEDRLADTIIDAATGRAIANTKVQTFHEGPFPTAITIGDTWIDSTDNNRQYRALTLTGLISDWIDVQDGSIAVAKSTADQAILDAAAAEAAAQSKSRTYYTDGTGGTYTLTLSGTNEYLTVSPVTLQSGDTARLTFNCAIGSTVRYLFGSSGAYVYFLADNKLSRASGLTVYVDAVEVFNNQPMDSYMNGSDHIMEITATASRAVEFIGASYVPNGYFDGVIKDVRHTIAGSGTTIYNVDSGDIITTAADSGSGTMTYFNIISNDWSGTPLQPTGVNEGDKWYDLPTRIESRYNGTDWDVTGNSFDNTNDLTDGANFAGRADWSTVVDDGNRPVDNANIGAETYRTNTEPSAPIVEGSLWYKISTKEEKRYTLANGWELTTNGYNDTNDLNDGANLGSTAEWDNVTNLGGRRPADNATDGATWGTGNIVNEPNNLNDISTADESRLSQAGSDATQAIGDSSTALTLAGTKTQTFRQDGPIEPSAITVGDTWIDTNDNNRMYRAGTTGTGGWVDTRDLTIAVAQAEAESKVQSYFTDGSGGTYTLTLAGNNEYLTVSPVTLQSGDTAKLTFNCAVGSTVRYLFGSSGAYVYFLADNKLARASGLTIYIDAVEVFNNQPMDSYMNGSDHIMEITATASRAVEYIGASYTPSGYFDGVISNISHTISGSGTTTYNVDTISTTNLPADSGSGTITFNNIITSDWTGTPAEPSSPTDGDLWFDSTTRLEQRYNGIGWDNTANGFNLTSDLSDDAELGRTARWSRMNNDDGNLPANKATAGSTWNSDITGQPTDANVLNANTTASDIGYIGDLDATRGSTWNSNITGQPTDANVLNVNTTASDIGYTGDLNATRGSTWNSDITGQPTDANVLNSNTTAADITATDLASIVNDLGTITAGDITSATNIEASGTSLFDGDSASAGRGSGVVIVNESKTTPIGILTYGGTASSSHAIRAYAGTGSLSTAIDAISTTSDGVALHGTDSGGGWGVVGVSSSASGVGGLFSNSTGEIALECDGGFQVDSGSSEGGEIVLKGYSGAYDIALDSTGSTTATTKFRIFWNTDVKMEINNDGDMWIKGDVSGATITNRSDKRLKENIRPFKDALSKARKLSSCIYDLIDGSAKDQLGYIAQEVEEFLPEVVTTDSYGFKGLQYGRISAVLSGAIDEEAIERERLEAEVTSLKAEVYKLKDDMYVISKLIKELIG